MTPLRARAYTGRGPATSENGVVYHTYKSAASCVLTEDQVETINCCLEYIMENTLSDDGEASIYQKEIDFIDGAVDAGEERMQKLHDALGAFHVNYEGVIHKPDSERIDWSASKARRREEKRKEIRVVK